MATDRSGERLQRAQLDVLSRMMMRVPDEDRPRQEEKVEEEANRYIAEGLPAGAFTPEELKRAALNWTASRLAKSAGIDTVNQARRQYGIDPEELYPLLPPRKTDAVQQFRKLAQGHDIERVRKTHLEPFDPKSVKGIIEAAEEAGSDGLPIAIEMLARDWSKAGRAYLYAKLLSSGNPELAQQILWALTRRQQVDAAALGQFVEATTDEKLLAAAFRVADASRKADPEAKQFLTNELTRGGPKQRVLALKSLSRELARIDVDLVVSVIRQEANPETRAGLLGSLGPVASDTKILGLLRELIINDPSPQVRLAAVEAIPDSMLTPLSWPVDPARVEQIPNDDLRGIAANASPELKAAVEAKIASAAAKAQEAKDRAAARLRERAARAQSRLARR